MGLAQSDESVGSENSDSEERKQTAAALKELSSGQVSQTTENENTIDIFEVVPDEPNEILVPTVTETQETLKLTPKRKIPKKVWCKVQRFLVL